MLAIINVYFTSHMKPSFFEQTWSMYKTGFPIDHAIAAQFSTPGLAFKGWPQVKLS